MRGKVHINVNIAENTSCVSIIWRCIERMVVVPIHSELVPCAISVEESFVSHKSSKFTLRECTAVSVIFTLTQHLKRDLKFSLSVLLATE